MTYQSPSLPPSRRRWRDVAQCAWFVLLLCWVISQTGCGVGDSHSQDRHVTFTIIQTSDLHHHAAGYGPSSDYTPLNTGDNDSVAGGYARIAAVVQQIRDEQAEKGIPVLLVDSGDFLMGTVYDLAYHDPLALRFISEMRYDAVTLGNHEFDWGPGGLAGLIQSGMDHGFRVPIVASNLVTDPMDSADDALEALITQGIIAQSHRTILPNGISVGILGIMGHDADSKTPAAEPCRFDHDDAAIQKQVDQLKQEQDTDVILLLSHSGIAADGTGEDSMLARHVSGIDVIASGHAHTATSSAFLSDDGGTILFSPGEYGKTICRLDMTYDVTRKILMDYTFTLIPVDDGIAGEPEMAHQVATHQSQIDAALDPVGVTTDAAVSRTDVALELTPLTETALGNVVADAMRASANAAVAGDDAGFFQLGVVASGVIRDGLYPGFTGLIRFADVFNVLPMGTEPVDGELPGHALLSIYVKAQDIKHICEVAVSMAPLLDSDIFLNFSGVRFSYDSGAFIFNRVGDIFLCGPGDPHTEQASRRLDVDDTQTLYRVAVNQYAFELLAYTAFFGLPIVPRDRYGTAIRPEDRMNHLIDASSEDGLQRLTQWMALYRYLRDHFPADGQGISLSLYR